MIILFLSNLSSVVRSQIAMGPGQLQVTMRDIMRNKFFVEKRHKIHHFST